MEQRNTGILLDSSDIKLHRAWFEEMCSLLGIICIYRAPRENKTYDGYGEFDTFFYAPIKIGCILDEAPTQYTMKKLGWASELDENSCIIHVPYDLEKLQIGALFIIPSNLDNTKGRVFRLVRMSTNVIYPASIACEIVPEYENTFENSNLDFKCSNFNLLRGED